MKLFGTYRRASAGMEAALALPVMLVLFGAVSQVLITSQSRVHLEQAAYAAARSALAHKCPPFNILAVLRSPAATIFGGECETRRGQLDAIAQKKAEDAARWALIAAAPTTGSASGRGCDRIPAAEDLLTRGDMIGGRNQAALNALCYVFEPGNVTVTLEWQETLLSRITGRTEVPIRATVQFRYPLSTPFRRFVRDGERGDGTYWKSGSASVTLL
ncbi:MAG: hypothetical protein HKN18_14685 [Silicimonas sp.]|nr:hypothetical protein [Silicimonas sp.]